MPLSGSLDSVQHFAKITDWDRAYSNRAAIPNALQIFETMLSEGTDFRRQHGASLDADIPYGDHPRETIDVFHPGGTALGTSSMAATGGRGSRRSMRNSPPAPSPAAGASRIRNIPCVPRSISAASRAT